MGRLAGFKYREVVHKLRALGFAFDRLGPGSHEFWRHTLSGRKVTLPITVATWPRERCAPFCARRASILTNS